MKAAYREALKAYAAGEVPVGCVIVLNDKIIARAHNLKKKKKSALEHAEIIAITKAAKKLGGWRLLDTELYVTLEPCPMCAGAIMQSRVKRVVFGAYDPKAGSLVSLMHMYEVPGYNHYPAFEGGVYREPCSQILTRFFHEIRFKSPE